MKQNIGTTDRVLRIIIAIAIIVYGVLNNSLIGIIGIIPLMTAMLKICPLYSIFGISTCSVNKTEE